MIVTVKDLRQNTNKEDFRYMSFTRENCTKEELQEFKEQIKNCKNLTSKQKEKEK